MIFFIILYLYCLQNNVQMNSRCPPKAKKSWWCASRRRSGARLPPRRMSWISLRCTSWRTKVGFHFSSMKYIENLGNMMNRMILKFFKESNRTESVSEFSIDIFSIFVREKQWKSVEKQHCFFLTKNENISIVNSDKLSVLLLSLKNFNIIQFIIIPSFQYIPYYRLT